MSEPETIVFTPPKEQAARQVPILHIALASPAMQSHVAGRVEQALKAGHAVCIYDMCTHYGINMEPGGWYRRMYAGVSPEGMIVVRAEHRNDESQETVSSMLPCRDMNELVEIWRKTYLQES